MRIVIELLNGCVADISADERCEGLVIDRDQCADELLPDGERGYLSLWDVSADGKSVDGGFKFAESVSS